MSIFYINSQQFWKCYRTIDTKKQIAVGFNSWNQRDYEYRVFIAPRTYKEYMYGNYIATKKQMTNVTKKQRSD